MDFDTRKRSVMEGLASDEKDKSRKGGVDAPIAALITRINSHPLFFTTSSCSGRVSIFSEASSLRTVGSAQAQEDVTGTNLCTPETNIEEDGNQKMDTDTRKKKKKKKKKGGDWVYVTHDAAIADEVPPVPYGFRVKIPANLMEITEVVRCDLFWFRDGQIGILPSEHFEVFADLVYIV